MNTEKGSVSAPDAASGGPGVRRGFGRLGVACNTTGERASSAPGPRLFRQIEGGPGEGPARERGGGGAERAEYGGSADRTEYAGGVGGSYIVRQDISRSLGGSSETRRQFRKVQDSAALDEMHYQGIIGQQTEPK